jgi:predicted nucleotide-binding protein
MAKKVQPATVDNSPTELILSKVDFNNALDKRIELGEELYSRPVQTQADLIKDREDFNSWSDYNSEFLKQAFSKEYNEYRKSYNDAGSFSIGLIGRNPTPSQELQKFKSRIESKLSNLKKLRAKTDLLKTRSVDNTLVTADIVQLDKSQVFIVHGHDEAAKSKTARFIEKLGLKPIILHEQASGSKTVIEKIETYSNVGFGIVIYTPCDIGAKNEEKPNIKNRARQNVVFEHGFLIGKIGRENVCALVKDEIETPNDISGVVYVKMDEEEAWHLKIARELRNSGYEIDMNKL